MKDDIQYIGINLEENEQIGKKSNQKVIRNREKFKVNKHNLNLSNFIRSTKFNYNKRCKIILIILIILAIFIFKPITFMKSELAHKREKYAQEDNFTFPENFNLFDSIIYASGYNYYKDLKGTLSSPLEDSIINMPYDVIYGGMDLTGNYQQEAKVAYDGNVVEIGNNKKYGKYVLVMHNIKGYTIYTCYGNLDKIYVNNGQYLYDGQPVGTIFGNANGIKTVNPDIAHLYFAVRKSPKISSSMNPLIFIKNGIC